MGITRRQLIQGGVSLIAGGTPRSLFADDYNVSYGVGPNLVDMIRRYNVVYRSLEANQRNSLVIQRRPDGNFALVEPHGDRRETFNLAKQRGRQLPDVETWILKEEGHPVVYSADDFLGLSATHDQFIETMSPLESDIEKLIKGYRQRGILLSTEHTAWSAYDLNRDEAVLSINQEVPYQAASMIKPLVGLGILTEAAQGNIEYDDTTKTNMVRMIRFSNNYVTNDFMRHFGGPEETQEYLQTHYPDLFDNLQLVEFIPHGGRTYRNRASAHDYNRFLRALWRDELPQAEELKRLMALPGKDRIFKGAKHIPNGTRVYNKTGTTAKLCGDMGILEPKKEDGSRFAYTMVGIIQDETRKPGSSLRKGNVIREVSNHVYEFMKERHNTT